MLEISWFLTPAGILAPPPFASSCTVGCAGPTHLCHVCTVHLGARGPRFAQERLFGQLVKVVGTHRTQRCRPRRTCYGRLPGRASRSLRRRSKCRTSTRSPTATTFIFFCVVFIGVPTKGQMMHGKAVRGGSAGKRCYKKKRTRNFVVEKTRQKLWSRKAYFVLLKRRLIFD